MIARDDVSAVILAGGRATRLGGVDKRQLVIDGRTIFDRQVDALAPRVAEILVSSRPGRDVAGYRTVHDSVADLGPLGGIAAGLAAATTPWLLVIAGDMPGINGPLIELLLAHGDAEADAVAIRIGDRAEPLCAAYRVAVWAAIVTGRIATRQLRASALLTDEPVRVRWIDEAAVRRLDPALRALRNVNAPGDL